MSDKNLIESLQKQIDILKNVAGKNNYDKHTPREAVGLSFRVTMYSDDEITTPALVEKWRMVKNAPVLRKGESQDNQTIEITMTIPRTTEKGTTVYEEVKKEMQLIDFGDLNKKTVVRKSTIAKDDGRVLYTFDLDGEEREIDVTFIN